jgi:hypothetical protein
MGFGPDSWLAGAGADTISAPVADQQVSTPLEKFAAERGLSYAAGANLPSEGTTLGKSGKVEGAASGKLPSGGEATMAHYSYTETYTDADDHTHTTTYRLTIVVTQLPESIGFVPYLGFSATGARFSPSAGSTETRAVDLGEVEALKSYSAAVYKGTKQSWLTQLLSPALLEWLSRSEDDFGFELANGVLCVGRNSHLTQQGELDSLWSDADHLAAAIHKECAEESETGAATKDAAEEVGGEDPRMEAALAKAKVGSPPDVSAATGTFSGLLMRSPSTYLSALLRAIAWFLVVNLFLSALTINAFVQGNDTTKNVTLAIEAVILALLFFFALRRLVRTRSDKYAAEAFYRGYAADRNLRIEKPLAFAASHADAKLPFKPDRVFGGTLPGGFEGSLAIIGDGSKRSDQIAMVAGPKGPYAADELRAEGPGISAKSLDAYVTRLEEEITAPSKTG